MPRRLHDLMDFNQAFNAYDSIDGANCLTSFGQTMTQKEAAVEAVQRIGLNQIGEIDPAIFARLPRYESMFRKRLALLREYDKTST